MAIQIRARSGVISKTTASASSLAYTPDVLLNGAVQANDIIVAVIGYPGAWAYASMDAGWTEVTGTSSGAENIHVFWKRSNGSEPATYNVYFNAARATMIQTIAFSGARVNTSPIAGATFNQGSTTSVAYLSQYAKPDNFFIGVSAFTYQSGGVTGRYYNADGAGTFPNGTIITDGRNASVGGIGTNLFTSYYVGSNPEGDVGYSAIYSGSKQHAHAIFSLSSVEDVAPVDLELSTAWDLNGLAEVNLDTVYDTRATADTNVVTNFHTLNNAATTTATSFNVYGDASTSKATSFDTYALTSATKATTFDTLANISTTKATSFNVQTVMADRTVDTSWLLENGDPYITLIGEVTADFNLNNTPQSATIGFPAGTKPGHLALMTVVREVAHIVGVPAGWTLIPEASVSVANDEYQDTYYRNVQAGDTTFTWTGDWATHFQLLVFRGVHQTSPFGDIDVAATPASPAATQVTLPDTLIEFKSDYRLILLNGVSPDGVPNFTFVDSYTPLPLTAASTDASHTQQAFFYQPDSNDTVLQTGIVMDQTGFITASSIVLRSAYPIQNAFVSTYRTSQWDTYALTEVNPSAAWDTSADLTVTTASAWGTYQIIQTTKASAWDAYNNAATTKTTSFDTMSTANTSKASVWDTAAAMADDLVPTSWDTQAAISDTKPVSWATQFSISGTTTTSFNTLAAVDAPKGSVWNTQAVVPDDLVSSSWTAYGTVTDNEATQWDTYAGISGTAQTIWHIADAGPIVTSDASWNTYGTADVTSAAAWDTRAALSDTEATTWNTMSNIPTISQQASWALMSAVPTTTQMAWDTCVTATTSTASGWDTYASTGMFVGTIWDLAAGLDVFLGSNWDVTYSAGTLTKGTSWDDYMSAVTNKGTIWDTTSSVDGSALVEWTTHQSILTGTSLEWTASQPLTKEFVSSWLIREAIGNDFNTNWKVAAVLGDETITLHLPGTSVVVQLSGIIVPTKLSNSRLNLLIKE